MKMLKSKAMAILIAALLTFSMTASMILVVPAARAASPSIPTYAFVNVAPNPAGVGQTVNIGMWLGQAPPTANGPLGDRWENFKVTVTLPDGTTTTLGPFTSDDTGGTHASYTPTALGNYTFFFSFPGQTLVGYTYVGEPPSYIGMQYIGDYFEPSNATTTLTVQQTPIPSIPVTPLPTTYWTRPIDANNNNWYSIAGNWLGLGVSSFANTGEYNATGNYNPYTTAPTTAHILWTQPEAFGGTMGGEFGGSETSNYYSTPNYEPKFAPIIMQGILYYTEYPGSFTTPTGIVAVNIQTGQTIWTDDGANYGGGSSTQTALTSAGVVTVLRCGQILDFVSPDQFGGLPYLWTTGTPAGISVAPGTTTYNLFDAMTGTYILSIVNGTSMTLTEDASGNLIGYYVNSTAGSQSVMGTINDDIGPAPTTVTTTGPSLNEWNSTECIMAGAWSAMAAGWEWRPPQGGIIPFGDGLTWRAQLPTSLNGVPLPSTLAIANSILGPASVNSGVIELTSFSGPISATGLFQGGFEVEAGYNANNGAQLWITNRTEPPLTRILIIGFGNGAYAELNLETSTIYGYSLNTGTQLWSTVLTNVNPYNSIGGYMAVLANDVLYTWGFGGNIWAINMANGTILWQTTTTKILGDSGSNTPYGVWPLWTFTDGTVAGGLMYIPVGHEYSPPLFRGAQEICLNITNGQPVWSILSFDVTCQPAISDGVATVLNSYDNQIYAFGKGPSETTVTAPDVGVTTATPITITGTVMDISAGSQQNAVAANFPHGLPCVSDASMTQFMEAVYMQQPMPTNITGVPVQIAVLDSNGNHYPIGTVTTDASGTFSLTWTPDIPGNFTVYATFAGTQSYYGSYAEAHFYASTPAPTAAPTAAPVTGLASTASLELGVAAVIIVIIICVAVLAVLMMRKRP